MCPLVILLSATFYSCTDSSGTVSDEAVSSVEKFDIKDVELLDGPFKHATDLNIHMLLDTFSVDRLMAMFRTEAGLEPKAEAYGGWESETIAGHTLGHYLTACALMYSTTNDERFADTVRYIVDELEICQKADPDGYIGAFKDGKKIFEEQVAKGDIRSQGFDLNGLWAPFYTEHKLFSGLMAAYYHVGVEKAIPMSEKFADWIMTIVQDLDEDQIQEMLDCEHGGINESFVELYAVTGKEQYLQLSNIFYHQKILDSLAHHKDILPGKHANTQIPKLIGLARRYEVTGNENDKEAAKFFWDRVVNHHSYVTGGHSNHEYFGQPDHLTNRLSANTTETCNVYNMLKLSNHLFGWEPGAEVADFYERALFNQILSSQHPHNGHVIYNMSLEMGGFKVYQNPYWFTCCVGTGLENHSKYSGTIYFHNDRQLYVNQFIASKLNWEEKGLTLTQETEYPKKQSTLLTVEVKEPVELSIKLRYPYWAEKGVKVTVNGQEQQVANNPQSFITLHRTWDNGDVIEMEMPFTLRLESMPDDADRIAVMYGPLALAGDLGAVEDTTAYDPMYVPVIMSEDRNPADWLKPVSGQPNTFETEGVGTPRNFVLKPFYATHDRRYSVYFDIFSKEKWAQFQVDYQAKLEAKKELEAKTIDFFQMGEMQPERDHAFKGEKAATEELKGKKARQAERGGYFEFTMKVLSDQPMEVVAEYWGGYTGSKTFDIVVEGQVIATENITDKAPGEFIDVHYPIPETLTAGKKSVGVEFQPHEGHRAGPVFSVRTIK